MSRSSGSGRSIRHTLFGQISLGLMLLLCSLGPLQYFVIKWTFERADDLTLQRDMWELAREYAETLRPHLKPPLNQWAIENAVFGLSRINPLVDAFLVAKDGTVLYSFSGDKLERERVAVGPIDDFFCAAGTSAAPLYGDDPSSRKESGLISVHPVTVGATPAYLYLVLRGHRHSSQVFAENYLVRFGMISTLTGVLVIVVTGVGLFYLLSRRVSLAVGTMRRFRDGDQGARIGFHSNDELGELAATFDEMADTIVSSVDALRERDVRRRELIATISHDLRGPLANIRAHITRIQQSLSGRTEHVQDESLEIVQRNAGQLGDLLSQLFELAKLEAREIAPDLEDHPIEVLLEDVVNSYGARAAGHGIVLRYELADPALSVRADLTMIGRVMNNLVENAIRFTPAGGEVVLAATASETKVRVSVRDTGAGIAEDDLPKIFEKFYQGEGVSQTDKAATGLGLAIVRRLVELHGTEIGVSSVPGSGTEFYFFLDRAALTGRAASPDLNR